MKIISRKAASFLATKDVAADKFALKFKREFVGMAWTNDCLLLGEKAVSLEIVNNCLDRLKKRRWVEWDINGRWLGDFTRIGNVAARDATTLRYICEIVRVANLMSAGPLVLLTSRDTEYNVRATFYSVKSSEDLIEIEQTLPFYEGNSQYWLYDPLNQYTGALNTMAKDSNLLIEDYEIA